MTDLLDSVPRDAILSGTILLIAGLGVLLHLPLLAAPALLFLPGYALCTVLYPGKDDLNWSDRLITAMALNISVVSLTALALSLMGLPLFAPGEMLFVALITVSLTLTIISVMRRHRCIQPYDLQLSRPSVRSFHQLFLAIVLISAIILAAGWDADKPVEFYLLGKNSTLNYSNTIDANGMGSALLVVENHGPAKRFKVEADLGGILLESQNFTLDEEERWEHEVGFNVRSGQHIKPNSNSTLNFRLYESGDSPIRELHLRIGRI